MNPVRRAAVPALLLALGLLAGTPAHAQNLVTNGGFEDYNGITIPDWTVSGNANQGAFADTFLFGNAHSGDLAAWLGTPDSDGYLSQDIATTAGHTYTLTFFLAVDADSTPSDFAVSFGGQTLFTAADLTPTDGPPDPADDYTPYTFTAAASGATSGLTFGFRNDNSWFQLDDVAVTDNAPGPGGSPVPEPPGTAVFGLTALIGAALAARRSRARR